MKPDNVLLLTVDSVRADSVPLFSDGTLRTETLRRLSEDGVSFDSAFATGPATAYSFPGILTGTLPLSHGGLGPLDDERPRLSRWLRDAGFRTGGFQSNPFLSRHFNYDDGFDRFEDYQNPLMGVATKIFPRGIELNDGALKTVDEWVDLTGKIKKAYQLLKGKPRPYVDASVITDDALDWMAEQSAGFFCWAHYMDVHHPCHPPERYRAQFDVADVSQTEVSDWYSTLVSSPEDLSEAEVRALERLYRAAIAYTDDQIGRILDHLEASGRYENTLVVYTSDHGELFGEYGQYGKPERMFDELLKVPLVVTNGPDHLERARSEVVSLLDVPGIVLDALGVETPPTYEGRRPGRDPPREYAIGEHKVDDDVVLGVRTRSHLYELDEIRGERRGFEAGDGTMRRVPDEEIPPVAKRTAEERLSELDRESRLLDGALDAEAESRLEDLGYL